MRIIFFLLLTLSSAPSFGQKIEISSQKDLEEFYGRYYNDNEEIYIGKSSAGHLFEIGWEDVGPPMCDECEPRIFASGWGYGFFSTQGVMAKYVEGDDFAISLDEPFKVVFLKEDNQRIVEVDGTRYLHNDNLK